MGLVQEHLIKGAYNYYYQGRLYSEEFFNVIRNNEDQSLIFHSEVLTRVANGEFLKIESNYHMNDKFFPKKVNVLKSLGQKKVEEIFVPDPRKQSINYEFIEFDTKGQPKNDSHKVTVPAPGRYQVGIPSMATSFLFNLSKKYDSTSINRYNLVVGKNDWEFQAKPENKTIFLHASSLSLQEIKIRDKTLMATKYTVFDDEDHDPGDPNEATYHVSKYYAIPYQVEGADGILIQIRFLNNLELDRDE